MNKREIPKNIQFEHELSNDIIIKISELCFLPNAQQLPQIIDVLFIFGTAVSYEDIREIVKILGNKAQIKNIIITGGIVNYSDIVLLNKPESHLILAHINDVIPVGTNIYIEDKSTNTLDNILFSMSHIETIKCNSLLYITKSFHTRRAYLTLKKILPDVNLYSYSYDAFFVSSNIQLTKQNWMRYDEFKQRILGEVERIVTYGSRGDICYPKQVKELAQSYIHHMIAPKKNN